MSVRERERRRAKVSVNNGPDFQKFSAIFPATFPELCIYLNSHPKKFCKSKVKVGPGYSDWTVRKKQKQHLSSIFVVVVHIHQNMRAPKKSASWVSSKWVKSNTRRKKKVSENNGQLRFRPPL